MDIRVLYAHNVLAIMKIKQNILLEVKQMTVRNVDLYNKKFLNVYYILLLF